MKTICKNCKYFKKLSDDYFCLNTLKENESPYSSYLTYTDLFTACIYINIRGNCEYFKKSDNTQYIVKLKKKYCNFCIKNKDGKCKTTEEDYVLGGKRTVENTKSSLNQDGKCEFFIPLQIHQDNYKNYNGALSASNNNLEGALSEDKDSGKLSIFRKRGNK